MAQKIDIGDNVNLNLDQTYAVNMQNVTIEYNKISI